MWTNGNVYFFTLLAINVLDLVLVALSITIPNNEESYVTGFLDPITAILNCKFLLDLYETNARLERGGASLSWSLPDLSLHFTGVGPSENVGAPSGGSSFLGSFAGPVRHLFSDDGMEEFQPADGEPEAGASIEMKTMTRTAAEGSHAAV
ncbi:hypothetical protein C2E23DRAFT_35498 [Lenzites betulinus]|nr:hypothetical protein C2E23DRAFT_35498 [Lenzites betulinus]